MKCLWVYIERKYFAINTGFAYPSSNELGILRAKVEYDYRFVTWTPQKKKTSMSSCVSKVAACSQPSNYRLATNERAKRARQIES